MSGDIQPRKRKGKGKKKDEAEEDIMESKGKAVVNNSHKSSSSNNNGGGGEGSGIVAKIIFLILLVSLSVVIGLILIELRGKHVGLETASVVPKAEEHAPPEIPTPSLHVDEEPIPEPPPPILESEVEEEFVTLEATPPLEEYIKVERVVEEVRIDRAEGEIIDSAPVGGEKVIEVVEIVEEVPVEVVEEIIEVNEVPVVESEAEAAAVEVEESAAKEVADEVEAAAPEVDSEIAEELEEALPEDDVEKLEEVPVESEEAAASAEVEEPEVEDAPLSEEKIIYTEEAATAPPPPVEKVVEEPAISETVEELDAPVPKEQSVDEEEVDAKEPDDDDNEDQDDEVEDDDEPEIDDDDDDDDDDDESDEDWSQYGKEGGAGALTEAYLRVETLAEEVLQLDPENSMVNQLAPHLSGVLRAMEEGRTEGLLDTLSHIQVILEDVKRRIIEESSSAQEEVKDTKPTYEKADITSDVDDHLREDLDTAEKLISEGP